jgi:ribosomal protein L35AE/L33A
MSEKAKKTTTSKKSTAKKTSSSTKKPAAKTKAKSSTTKKATTAKKSTTSKKKPTTKPKTSAKKPTTKAKTPAKKPATKTTTKPKSTAKKPVARSTTTAPRKKKLKVLKAKIMGYRRNNRLQTTNQAIAKILDDYNHKALLGKKLTVKFPNSDVEAKATIVAVHGQIKNRLVRIRFNNKGMTAHAINKIAEIQL